MPRASKKTKKSATGMETPLAETLETLKDEIPGLRSAIDLPRQLTPPEPILEPLPKLAADSPEPSPAREALAQPGPHTAAVVASRPRFATPNGFMNVSSHPVAGVKVNKSLDKRVAAIQFADESAPTRAEKVILEALGQTDEHKFSYSPASKQWLRPAPEGMYEGENIIDATRIAKELAEARSEGRGR